MALDIGCRAVLWDDASLIFDGVATYGQGRVDALLNIAPLPGCFPVGA